MSVLRTRDELVARLVADGVDVDADSADDRVFFPVEQEGFEATAVIVWPADVALVSVVILLPHGLVEGALGELCEAVVRLNHLLVLPGFGVDLAGGVLYFRSVQARGPDGSLPADALQRMVSAAVGTAASFGPGLGEVASGALSAADLEASLR